MWFASDNTSGGRARGHRGGGAGERRPRRLLRRRRGDGAGDGADPRDLRGAGGGGLPGRHRHGGERAGARLPLPALGDGLLPPQRPRRGGRMRRAGVLHRRREADAARRRARQDRARRASRRRWPSPCAPACTTCRRARSASPTPPSRAPSTRPTRWRRWPRWRAPRACRCTWTARASPTRSSAARLHAGRAHLEGRGRRAELRRHQERLPGGRGGGAVRSGPRLGVRAPAQARRASLLQAPVPVGADGGLSRRRALAATWRRGPTRGPAELGARDRRAAGRAAAASGRGEHGLRRLAARRAPRRTGGGRRVLPLAGRARAWTGPADEPLAARLVCGWSTRRGEVAALLGVLEGARKRPSARDTGSGWVIGTMWPAPGTVTRTAAGAAAAMASTTARDDRRRSRRRRRAGAAPPEAARRRGRPPKRSSSRGEHDRHPVDA